MATRDPTPFSPTLTVLLLALGMGCGGKGAGTSPAGSSSSGPATGGSSPSMAAGAALPTGGGSAGPTALQAPDPWKDVLQVARKELPAAEAARVEALLEARTLDRVAEAGAIRAAHYALMGEALTDPSGKPARAAWAALAPLQRASLVAEVEAVLNALTLVGPKAFAQMRTAGIVAAVLTDPLGEGMLGLGQVGPTGNLDADLAASLQPLRYRLAASAARVDATMTRARQAVASEKAGPADLRAPVVAAIDQLIAFQGEKLSQLAWLRATLGKDKASTLWAQWQIESYLPPLLPGRTATESPGVLSRAVLARSPDGPGGFPGGPGGSMGTGGWAGGPPGGGPMGAPGGAGGAMGGQGGFGGPYGGPGGTGGTGGQPGSWGAPPAGGFSGQGGGFGGQGGGFGGQAGGFGAQGGYPSGTGGGTQNPGLPGQGWGGGGSPSQTQPGGAWGGISGPSQPGGAPGGPWSGVTTSPGGTQTPPQDPPK